MTPDDDLPCSELVDLVTDHLDGALDASTSTRLEEHLTTCEGCTLYVDQIRTTVELLGGLPPPHLPDAARVALLEAHRSSRPSP